MAELGERLLLELSKTDSLSSLDVAKLLSTDHQVREWTRQFITRECLENSWSYQEPGVPG